MAALGLLVSLTAIDADRRVIAIFGSAMGAAFLIAVLAAVTWPGALGGPLFVIVGYAASLVWLALWVQSCPDDCFVGEIRRREVGDELALYLGVVAITALATAIAGSVVGVHLKRFSSRAAPCG
jgi:hypothetical protein